MKCFFFFFLAIMPLLTWAQVPTINPTATYYMTKDNQEESGVISADPNAEPAPPLNAPVRVVFQANPSRPFPRAIVTMFITTGR